MLSPPKGRIFCLFSFVGRGSDYSSDEKVSFLWEVVTKQAPGNPQADQSQDWGEAPFTNDHTGAFALKAPLSDWAP